MIPDKLTIPTSEETRSEAIQTLIEHLGITKAALFLKDSRRQKVDYLQIKDELFGGRTAADLYDEIKKGKPIGT